MDRILCAVLEEAQQIEATPLDHHGWGTDEILADSFMLPTSLTTSIPSSTRTNDLDKIMAESSPNPFDILSSPRIPLSDDAKNVTMFTTTNTSTAIDAVAPPPKDEQKQYWKKPKDMPRRPLSAYNLFFQSERQKLVAAANAADGSQQDPSKAPIKKRRRRKRKHTILGIGFAGLARKIAKQWKELSDEEKSVFDVRARAEKERYKKEMEIWKSKNKEQMKARDKMKIKSRLMVASTATDYSLHLASVSSLQQPPSSPSSSYSPPGQQQHLLRALSNAKTRAGVLQYQQKQPETNKAAAALGGSPFPTSNYHQPSLLEMMLVGEREKQPATLMESPDPILRFEDDTNSSPPITLTPSPPGGLEIPASWSLQDFLQGDLPKSRDEEDDSDSLGTVDCHDSVQSSDVDEFEQFMESIESGDF